MTVVCARCSTSDSMTCTLQAYLHCCCLTMHRVTPQNSTIMTNAKHMCARCGMARQSARWHRQDAWCRRGVAEESTVAKTVTATPGCMQLL